MWLLTFNCIPSGYLHHILGFGTFSAVSLNKRSTALVLSRNLKIFAFLTQCQSSQKLSPSFSIFLLRMCFQAAYFCADSSLSPRQLGTTSRHFLFPLLYFPAGGFFLNNYYCEGGMPQSRDNFLESPLFSHLMWVLWIELRPAGLCNKFFIHWVIFDGPIMRKSKWFFFFASFIHL